MKKLFYITIFILISKSSFAQFESYENAKTNQELIEFLESDIDRFTRFLEQFTEPEKINKTKEATPFLYQFDKEKFEKEVDGKSHFDFHFLNSMEDGKIKVYIFKDPKVYNSLDDIGTILKPTKMYYHDGTTEILTDKLTLDRHFSNNLNIKKAVRQMDVELSFSTPTELDSIVLSPNNVVKKKDFNFEIVQQDNQSAIIKTNAQYLKFTNVQAITLDNKRIINQGYRKLNMDPDNFQKLCNKLIKKTNDILEISKKDSLMDETSFKAKFLSNLELIKKDFDFIFDNDSDETYITYDFGAPIKKIILYYYNGQYEKKITNTLKPKRYQNILSDYNDGIHSFYNLNGQIITEIEGTYIYENDRFYSTTNQYVHLDTNQKKMIPLSYYQIEALTNDFILAREDDESPTFLIDGDNNKLMQVDNYKFDKDFLLTLIQSNDKYYILNNENPRPVAIESIDELSYVEKGYFIVKKNNKYGFMDSHGKIIIPIQYDDAKGFDDFVDLTFQDKLFAVKKEDKWGFVDAQNKTIIPFMYSDIKGPFSYGIAPVYINGKLGLINLNNKKLSQFISSSNSSSSNFGKRAFGLVDGRYNYLGELEEN